MTFYSFSVIQTNMSSNPSFLCKIFLFLSRQYVLTLIPAVMFDSYFCHSEYIVHRYSVHLTLNHVATMVSVTFALFFVSLKCVCNPQLSFCLTHPSNRVCILAYTSSARPFDNSSLYFSFLLLFPLTFSQFSPSHFL
jgi:hypothetical protein